MQIFELVSLCILLSDMAISFVTVKFSLGRKLETIRAIGREYLENRFMVDVLTIGVMILYLSTRQKLLVYLRLVTLLKVPECLEKVSKLEVYFIENYYNEQYWSLCKVFLLNFCFAHLLAVILVAMAKITPEDNWMRSKGISGASWSEQYVWAYYWATTIMLTIGFGDMVPVSWQEAVCMIFVETISCMVLAYNINCVGSLISNIRAQDLETEKQLKVFKKLADKHQITEGLNSKINNYIEEAGNIKKMFNIEEEQTFVDGLPARYRADYLKEANKVIFQKLFFFESLLEKSLFALAENI